MIIYGLPTTGKSVCTEKISSTVLCVDTDYPHSLWTCMGDRVPDVIRPFRKINSSASSDIKALILERVSYLSKHTCVLVFTNIASTRLKYDFIFVRPVDDAVRIFMERSPDLYTVGECREKIELWLLASQKIDSDHYVVLKGQSFISDYLSLIKRVYKKVTAVAK